MAEYWRRFWAARWSVKGPVIAVVAVALVVARVGGEESAPAAVASPCVPVHTAVTHAITEGLTVTGGGTLRAVYGVRSPDHEKVWYVAGDIQGPGLGGGGDIATWAVSFDPATGALGGLITSADATAAEFSNWPRHESVSGADEAARDAQRCARSG